MNTKGPPDLCAAKRESFIKFAETISARRIILMAIDISCSRVRFSVLRIVGILVTMWIYYLETLRVESS